MDVPSDWPTEIKSGKTLTLAIPTGRLIANITVNAKYTYQDNVISIYNIQSDTTVAIIMDPHTCVEIGGIKWATMNIGASEVTDYGLWFAWGETQGYTAD